MQTISPVNVRSASNRKASQVNENNKNTISTRRRCFMEQKRDCGVLNSWACTTVWWAWMLMERLNSKGMLLNPVCKMSFPKQETLLHPGEWENGKWTVEYIKEGTIETNVLLYGGRRNQSRSIRGKQKNDEIVDDLVAIKNVECEYAGWKTTITAAFELSNDPKPGGAGSHTVSKTKRNK